MKFVIVAVMLFTVTLTPLLVANGQLANMHAQYPQAQFEKWYKINAEVDPQKIEAYKVTADKAIDRLREIKPRFEAKEASARAKFNVLESFSEKIWNFGNKSDAHFVVAFSLALELSAWAQPYQLCLATDCE
jgi:hypothetical protein